MNIKNLILSQNAKSEKTEDFYNNKDFINVIKYFDKNFGGVNNKEEVKIEGIEGLKKIILILFVLLKIVVMQKFVLVISLINIFLLI